MTTVDLKQVEIVLFQATKAAQEATSNWLAKHGDRDACGFAWVKVWDVRSNSKLGKVLCSAGFSKAYGGGLQLWNPSKAGCQSISALEAGADAYANYIKAHLGLEKVYSQSRMD